MEVINGGRSNQKQKSKVPSGVWADGTKWKIAPCCTVTAKDVLSEYLAIVTKAAEAAINVGASDPVEEAAWALTVGFGAAVVSRGRQLNAEGYAQGDFECKGSLGLLDEKGKETAQYYQMRAEIDAKHTAEREAERLTLQ